MRQQTGSRGTVPIVYLDAEIEYEYFEVVGEGAGNNCLLLSSPLTAGIGSAPRGRESLVEEESTQKLVD